MRTSIRDIFEIETDSTDWPTCDGPLPQECKDALRDLVLAALRECHPLKTYEIYDRIKDKAKADSRCRPFNTAAYYPFLYGCVERAARAADCEQRWHAPPEPEKPKVARGPVPGKAGAASDISGKARRK